MTENSRLISNPFLMKSHFCYEYILVNIFMHLIQTSHLQLPGGKFESIHMQCVCFSFCWSHKH